jgi:hypothetical protein
MSRCSDIAQQEFPELSPPEIVFSLGPLQWRYYDHIENFARGRFQSEQAREAPSPTDVN